MAWSPLTGASAFDVTGAVTQITATSGAVSVGDVINCGVTIDITGGAATGGSVTDNLGNTYTRKAAVNDTTQNQRIETWFANVTVAGTPTVKLQFTPTPGTSIAGNSTLVVDPFSGSDASSTTEGTPAAQVQAAPGTGGDAVTSGSLTTTTNGDLIYAACVDTSSGASPGAVGTGFTVLQTSSASGVVVKTEYKVQATAGAVSGTFTATTGTDRFETACHAVKPAGGGGGGSNWGPLLGMQLNRIVQGI